MTIPSYTGQALVNAHLDRCGVANATATSDQRATALAEINRAYRQFLRGVFTNPRDELEHHLWSWLHPTSVDLTVAAQAAAYLTHGNVTFTAVATDETGEDVAVVVAAGTGALAVAEDTSTKIVTITLAVGGSTETAVVAACSALTLVTVTGAGAGNMAALAHTHLARHIAATALPATFGGLVEEPRFQHDPTDDKASQRIFIISPEAMDLKIRDWDGAADDPQYVCVRPKAFSTTLGSLYEAVFFPPPDAATVVSIRHRTDPTALADSASVYPMGTVGVDEAILAHAMANKERDSGQTVGYWVQRANELMQHLALEDTNLMPVESVQESYCEEATGMDDD